MSTETKYKHNAFLYKLIEDMPAQTLVDNANKSNHQWLLNHPDDLLTASWRSIHGKSSRFTNTSCELTAAAIRSKCSSGDDWNIINKQMTFEEVRAVTPIFQISIGGDWDSTEHILTIWGDNIVQSYYNQYETKMTPITPELISAINHIAIDNNYQIVTNDKSNLNITKLIYYWVPKCCVI